MYILITPKKILKTINNQNKIAESNIAKKKNLLKLIKIDKLKKIAKIKNID